jgi:hypothetical protein
MPGIIQATALRGGPRCRKLLKADIRASADGADRGQSACAAVLCLRLDGSSSVTRLMPVGILGHDRRGPCHPGGSPPGTGSGAGPGIFQPALEVTPVSGTGLCWGFDLLLGVSPLELGGAAIDQHGV